MTFLNSFGFSIFTFESPLVGNSPAETSGAASASVSANEERLSFILVVVLDQRYR